MEISKKEEKQIKDIEKCYYMAPSLKILNSLLNKANNDKQIFKNIFDKIYEVLISSKEKVEILLKERKEKGEIKDVKQAIKSIAGNSFSNLIIYIFLKNKMIGNIKSNIFITNKKSEIKNFNQISIINVDGETQKPDCDLIIYSKNQDDKIKKCIILSLKTSLRERAGQTYKWKLLLEIATSNNLIKDKYNISYKSKEMPFVCFATVNFYDEINNPQHRGMFKFFDKAFIAKEINSNFIARLSNLIDFVNEVL